MKPKLFLLATACCLFSICLFAQKKKRGEMPNRVTCTFGDVKPEDFASSVYSIDSSAEAVYLFDGGYTKFQGNMKGDFDIVHTIHERIRLLKKNSFDDLGKVAISVYHDDKTFNEQKLSDLQATTYNIENGQVTATKLDKSSFFKDKDGEMTTTKFTFPNLKEGSIIEYSYTISTPGRYLPTWVFQGNYPRLWSEYEIVVPQFYDYAVIKQGYVPYEIDTSKVSADMYHITEVNGVEASQSYSFTANTVNDIWAMKNVPALKKENYTTTLRNHVAKIEFQLSAIRYPDMPPRMIMRTWSDVSQKLMEDEDFGANLNHANNFFDNDVRPLIAGATSDEDKAKKVYEYVRDNFTCTDYDAMYLSQPIKKTFQTKKGNVADINLLLTSIFISLNMEANPVLLSTTDHGKAYEYYPILSKYNYVVCQLKLNETPYLLDAANNKLGFNHLDADCYNGYARVVSPAFPELINLSADSLKERNITSVFIINDKNNTMAASVNTAKTYEESLSLRDLVSKKGKETYFSSVKKSYSDNIQVKNPDIDSLQSLDIPVTVHYDLQLDNNNEDIIYFNPILAEQEKENPFTAAERYYPVEMPYCSDKSYILNMDIPDGYKVDELPKSARVKLNENEGMFEYLVAVNGDKIQLRTRLKLEKAVYDPEDYQTLREFYAFVVKKEAEQIVFKKSK